MVSLFIYPLSFVVMLSRKWELCCVPPRGGTSAHWSEENFQRPDADQIWFKQQHNTIKNSIYLNKLSNWIVTRRGFLGFVLLTCS